MAAEKQRAGGAVLDMDCDRRRVAALDRSRVERRQLTHRGRREVAGDAAHAKAVGPVRRHLDVDDRIVEAQQARIGGADRRIGRQFDDAGMVIADRQLGRRHQHAMRGDSADRRFLELCPGLRDHDTGRAEHAHHAGARVRRAAHDLHLAVAGIDAADAQPVGVGMRLGCGDARDDKAVERGGAVRDPLDIVAEHDQPLDQRAERRARREMGLEPGQRRLHAAPPGPMTPDSGPRTGEGMSSGRNP